MGIQNKQGVECDLEFPLVKKQLKHLDQHEKNKVIKATQKINRMTWEQIYATSSKGAGKRGLNWEVLKHQKTSDGKAIATIRLSKKHRARVTREGVYMRFISLHLDHDSAYKA
jgi:hypothetical protein